MAPSEPTLWARLRRRARSDQPWCLSFAPPWGIVGRTALMKREERSRWFSAPVRHFLIFRLYRRSRGTRTMSHAERVYRVLIVDDDETDRRHYGRLLARQAPGQVEIHQASDGAAGMAALRAAAFD